MNLCTDFTDPAFLDGLTGIVFDCDGVLFDSWEVNKTYYNTIRAGLDLPPMDSDMEHFVHAHAVQESIARITPEGRMDEAQAVRATVDYRDLIGLMRPEPGLVELLSAARSAGLRLGVYTNRTTTMELVLERFGLDHFFQTVITARYLAPKPNPEGMRRILALWRATAQEIAYVGDSILDEAVARKTDVAFWAYKSPKLSAAMHLTDFWTLRRHLVQRARGLQR